MKRFQFPLERVREWREKQIVLEQVRLEKVAAELRQIEERSAALEREVQVNETAVLRSSLVDSTSLGALHGFRLAIRGRRIALETACKECRLRQEAQEFRLLEARRNLRLLDKLKTRALSSWQAAFNKELDEQATESHLAKWNRS